MRKTLQASSIIGLMGLLGAGPAVSAPGDVNAHLRDINRLCDMQRRGELSPSPSYCLPELPPGPVYDDNRPNRH
jgi:hypothetical protein